MALKEGIVGKQLVDYFMTYERRLPIKAEWLDMVGGNQVQYRITFEDGSVSDWLVTFERSMTEDIIVSAEMFNEVIGAGIDEEEDEEEDEPSGPTRIQEENEYRFGDAYDKFDF